MDYWKLVLEGMAFGLFLALTLGPIFIALTRTSIEQGGREGMIVASGVWVSDFIIITLGYLFISSIRETVESATFKFWLEVSGGLVLILFGVGMLIKKTELNFSSQKITVKGFMSLWNRGFLVNTVNPFTFLFWLSVISTYVVGRKIGQSEALVFLGTIMLTIMLSDSAKVWLAKLIRKRLKLRHVFLFNKIAGIGLCLFGIFLIIKVNYNL